MHSLQNLVLSSLPYEELRSICLSPTPSRIKNIIDCSWEVWRDRALTNYNTPYAYFDLARDRNISGLERYLEVESYYKLTPHSTIRVYSNGFIEGVYESYAGLLEALERNSPEGVEIFYPRLNQAGRKKLEEKLVVSNNALAINALLTLDPKTRLFNEHRLIKSAQIEEAGKTNSPPPPETDEDFLLYLVKCGNEYAYEELFYRREIDRKTFFSSAIESGRIDFVDPLLREFYPTLPEGFSIETNIPLLPFTPAKKYTGEIFPLYNIGVYEIYPEYVSEAVLSLNPQILDFFRSLYQIGEVDGYSREFVDGYTEKRDPVKAYSILQRLNVKEELEELARAGNIDFILYAISVEGLNKESLLDIRFANEGNIPLLFTLIEEAKKVMRKEKIKKVLLTNIDKELYPLTFKLINSL